MINTSQKKLTVCSPGLHGQHSCHKWPRRMVTHGTGGSPTFAGRCCIFKHPLKQKWPIKHIPISTYPTNAEKIGANSLDASSTSRCRQHVQTPIRVKHNALLWLDEKNEQCEQLALGHINLGDSNDEILMVTENRVLSKRMQDWVTATTFKLQVKSYRLKVTG